jgi:ketosteroid isomerase-like protein
MFERFTEKARRAIFFARYEASQYGSPYIETEHLLLGLLREDRTLLLRFALPESSIDDIRAQIEKHVSAREYISTRVEIPLTSDSKEALTAAMDESRKLKHRYVGTEYMLLGLSMTEESLAGQLLRERGVEPQAIRAQLAEALDSIHGEAPFTPAQITQAAPHFEDAMMTLESFLAGLKSNSSDQSSAFFAESSKFVDSAGRRWVGRNEIEKHFEELFVPYTKKNVTFRVESAQEGPPGIALSSILWENITLGAPYRTEMHRMTLILAPENGGWTIHLLQVTPIIA